MSLQVFGKIANKATKNRFLGCAREMIHKVLRNPRPRSTSHKQFWSTLFCDLDPSFDLNKMTKVTLEVMQCFQILIEVRSGYLTLLDNIWLVPKITILPILPIIRRARFPSSPCHSSRGKLSSTCQHNDAFRHFATLYLGSEKYCPGSNIKTWPTGATSHKNGLG